MVLPNRRKLQATDLQSYSKAGAITNGNPPLGSFVWIYAADSLPSARIVTTIELKSSASAPKVNETAPLKPDSRSSGTVFG